MININKIIISLALILSLLTPAMFIMSPKVFAVSQQPVYFADSPLATPEPALPESATAVEVCKYDPNNPNKCLQQNPIYKWLEYFINLFVVIAVVGSAVMIAYAGIEYITAGGNQEKTKDARDKIRNVVIGLLALVFMSAFLQWLIPGGVF